ncbi:hypothetical protein P1X15_22440 [Runella sp. MFBS21]|uniref:glycosyltransferase family 2 protein n=1 Tax=Runella sp. MFBS21 TaxID=3034018 RepID=UPI0023F6DB6D|nr:hypothetical protein [Runella sp. MFBS21]MDF7820398.1 hypothetical protein [Runella sp. MFBS21]
MKKIDIAFVINSFNRFSLLKECLLALDWIPKSEFDGRIGVVVFEAGSTDGSLEWLQQSKGTLPFPLEIVVPLPNDDTSFAAGLNAGVDAAINTFPALHYLVFYETDNQIQNERPLQQALDQLIQRNDVGACGFTVKKHSGKPAGLGSSFPTVGQFLIGRQLVNRLHLDRPTFQWVVNEKGGRFSYVDVVYTSPLVVKKEAWIDSGGLDAKMFPFSDCDVDWAKRLSLLGWKMGVVDTEGVIHDNRETLSAWSKTRAMQFHRGRIRYLQRFHPIALRLAWPLPVMVRHLGEWLTVQLLVWQGDRRTQLSRQFKDLLTHSFKKYE